jgi:hypoxanthine phosphoribosyltransferase
MEEYIKKCLLTQKEIQDIIFRLAKKIETDYKNKNLTVVAILNGSLIFVADLLRRINLPLQIDCWSVSSYHGTKSTGELKFRQHELLNVDGRDILLVDDIFDTGLTLTKIKSKLINETKARSVACCTLLRKNITRNTDLIPEYVGVDIENEFVVGYGLDYNEQYRNLPYIGVLKEEAIRKYETNN